MKSILVGVLILASSLVQLSYAEPYHYSAARKSHNQQLGRRAHNPPGQDNWLGGTGNWSNGNDWSLNAPPGSSDDATIGSANDYVRFDVGTTTINSLTLAGTLTDRGIASLLTVSSFLNVASTGVLDFSSSSISLPGYMSSYNYGKITAAGLSVGTDLVGGDFENYGVLTVSGIYVAVASGFGNASGGTLTTTGGVLAFLSNAGDWENFGNVSTFDNQYGGSIENSGVLNNHSGGAIVLARNGDLSNNGTLNNDGSISASPFLGGEGGIFINTGVLNNKGTVTINGGFSNSGSVVNTGTFYFGEVIGFGGGDNTGSYVQQGPLSSTIVDSTLTTTTPLQINGGMLSGSGIIAGDVNMSGTLHSGDAPSSCANILCKTLTIQGNYRQFGIGTFYSELGGTQAGTDYDQLVITGNAILDGTLDVALLTGFVPKLGDTFFLLTYGSESGVFLPTHSAIPGSLLPTAIAQLIPRMAPQDRIAGQNGFRRSAFAVPDS